MLCAMCAAAVSAQQQLLSSRTLLAVVAAGNRAIVDLGIDDFVVDEAGAAREVVDVHVADYPIVLLLDTSGPPAGLDAIREAAARFVGRVGERDLAIVGLTNMMITALGDDRAKALADLKSIHADGDAPIVPLETIARAVRLVQEAEAPFSTIVLLSSRALDAPEAGAGEFLKPVLASRIPVNVIALRPAAAAAEAALDFLRDVANLTRGQYTTIYSPASFAIALERVADRLATELMIQFLVPPGSAAGGEVRVGVKVPGARVTGLGVSK
jgi:hypothetical protein